jgi:hypothetical protein
VDPMWTAGCCGAPQTENCFDDASRGTTLCDISIFHSTNFYEQHFRQSLAVSIKAQLEQKNSEAAVYEATALLKTLKKDDPDSLLV